MMLNRFLYSEEGEESSPTRPIDSAVTENIGSRQTTKTPRPTRSTLDRRIPNSKPHSIEMFKELDLLKLFRHDLISTNKPVFLLTNCFDVENRSQVISIISYYFEYLDNIFQSRPDTSYLDLINYSIYHYDDWLAYGLRFTEFITQNPGLFKQKNQVFAKVMRHYARIHPKGILLVREKLVEMLTTKNLNSGNAHVPVISFEMITYPIVCEYKIIEKIALMPTADSQLEYFVKSISMPSNTRNSVTRIVSAINAAIQSSPLSVFRPKVYVFGSIASDLATFDADLDLFIKLEAPSKDVETFDFETSMFALEAIDRVLSEKLNMSSLDAGKRIIPARRCPLLKYDFSAVFAHLFSENSEIQRCFSSASITVKSYHGVFSSKMIRFLTQCDPRFRKLTIILKHWAKRRELIKAGGIKSYGFTLLVIFFLQTRKPVVLPNIDRLKRVASSLQKENNSEPLDFSEYFEVVDFNKNCQSLAGLLVEFFQFYANFNHSYAICPRLGQMVAKRDLLELKSPAEKVGFNSNSLIWIEDPLAVGNNVSSSWSAGTCTKFLSEMKKVVASGINESNIFRTLYSNISFSQPPADEISFSPLDSTDIKVSTLRKLSSNSVGLKRVAKVPNQHLPKKKLTVCKEENDSELEFLGAFRGTCHQPKKINKIKTEPN